MERSTISNRKFVWLVAAGTLLAMLTLALSGVIKQQEAKAQPKEVTTAYALSLSDELLEFDVENPNDVDRTPITGLRSNETLVGIDFRPSAQPPAQARQGALYGISKTSAGTGFVYTINPNTGRATRITALLKADENGTITQPRTRVQLRGNSFGVDFNPTVDRLRIVSETDQNLRANVDTGGTITDGTLAYVDGDPNEGKAPWVTGVAYRNSQPSAFGGTTELYDLDAGRDILAQQTDANAGELTTIGDLGANIKLNTGFDIVTVGSSPAGDVAYAALQRKENKASVLFKVNLQNGKIMSMGRIDGPLTKVKGLAIPIGGSI